MGHHTRRVGRYTEYVQYLAKRGYPNLIRLYLFLKEEHSHQSTATYLDLKRNGECAKEHRIKTAMDIPGYAQDPLPQNILARVFVIEDLDTDMIEALGGSLNIEPTFFADHIADRFLERNSIVGQCPQLPSMSEITSFYTIDYFTAIALDKPCPYRLKCDSNVRRRVDTFHVDLRPGKRSQISRVAFVRRKFSFHVQRDKHNSWRVVVLVDPPIEGLKPPGGHSKAREEERNEGPYHSTDNWQYPHKGATFIQLFRDPMMWSTKRFKFTYDAFQGGHVDILPPPKFNNPDKWPSKDRRKEKSNPRDDLIHYWHHGYTNSRGQNISDEELYRTRRFLFDISRHALYIAASECMVNLEALHASADERIWNLKALDLSEVVWLQRSTNALERCLDDTLRLKHQLTGQCRHLNHVKEFVKSVAKIPSKYRELNDTFPLGRIPSTCDGHEKGESCGATYCPGEGDYGISNDFDFITEAMEHHRGACDKMIECVSSLMAVRDSHQAGTLARLGMIFAPITIACGVLSLPNNFGPGQQLFWVFWVAAPTLLLITFTLAWIPWDRNRFLSLFGWAVNDLRDGGFADDSPGRRFWLKVADFTRGGWSFRERYSNSDISIP